MAAIRDRVVLNARVLDLGCGYGRITSQLLSAGYENLRGYDISVKMIERAKTRYPQLDLKVADAAKLPEADNSVDTVVVSALFTSIPELQRRRAVADEIRRVLKRGGEVHGVEFLRERGAESGAFKSKAGIEMWHFEPEELRRLFTGFTRWESWCVNVPSLSGSPSAVLQFVAYDSA